MKNDCIAIARYRYSFSMTDPVKLPAYAGSLLRGQFGSALRRVSCITRAKTCEGCPLLQTCPYSRIFESPALESHTLQKFSHIPNPYVIEPPPIGTRLFRADEILNFNLVLIGTALEQLPLISFALEDAFRKGIGPAKSRGALIKIEVEDRKNPSKQTWNTIWDPSTPRIADHDDQTTFDLGLYETNGHDSITLHFKTPLRLQVQGKPVSPNELTPRKLFADMIRRITLLGDFHTRENKLTINVQEILEAAEHITSQHSLRWYDWKRYSSRQQQEMTLGGILGTWTMQGDIKNLIPFLKLGELTHIGKNATLGLGKFDLNTAST